MRGLLIAAPASGQGKTTITLGLLRALRNRGLCVASAKSGPDYIDPAFHAVATGRPCVTLDAWAASADQIRARSAMQNEADLLLIEGAMGLFDGAVTGAPTGLGSCAEVARHLDVPVVLILDASRMGQSAGAVVQGFSRYQTGVTIAGVVLNRVGSARHEQMLRAAVEPVCPVVGVLSTHGTLTLPSRHLGLVQAGEHAQIEAYVEHAAAVIAQGCDLDAMLELATPVAPSGQSARLDPLGQRIAVARDDAFSFCYWHMVEDWRAQGAEIRHFSPLANQAPDASADAIFLPGGYPELHVGTLADAETFQQGLHAAARMNTLIYGECGGYMVLGEGLIDADGQRHRMAGLLQLETSFADRTRHLGYRVLRGAGPFGAGPMHGHEFHYASTIVAKGHTLFQATDAAGGALAPMGLRSGQVMGSFAHVIERAIA